MWIKNYRNCDESIENLILQPFEVETQAKLKLEISEERKNSNFIEFLKHQDELHI